MKPAYDKAYFIAKFEAIPEEKWRTLYYNDDRDRFCALGHCGMREDSNFRISGVPEAWALHALLAYETHKINDGVDPRFPQPTPKQRILAALRSLP